VIGAVSARREAVVPLRVRGPSGIELSVDAIVDTGFTAALTLPKTVITALSLARIPTGGAVLADGSAKLAHLQQLSPDVHFGQLLANLGVLVEDHTDEFLWDVENSRLFEVMQKHRLDLIRRLPTEA
jgi:predicted aspartyl protease